MIALFIDNKKCLERKYSPSRYGQNSTLIGKGLDENQRGKKPVDYV